MLIPRFLKRQNDIVIITRSNITIFTFHCGVDFLNEPFPNQRINLFDDRVRRHSEQPRHSIVARPTFSVLPRARNKIRINLKLIRVQFQIKNIVVEHKEIFVHLHSPLNSLLHTYFYFEQKKFLTCIGKLKRILKLISKISSFVSLLASNF